MNHLDYKAGLEAGLREARAYWFAVGLSVGGGSVGLVFLGLLWWQS